MVKLDFGCGNNCKEGFEGVDIRDFGQKYVIDLRQPWPWEDNSVEEAYASHFVEHLDANERVYFVNELYRVMAPGAKCLMITPHWASNRAYGDLTHKWPPVSEMWFFYLAKAWRDVHAPHNDVLYTCDFDATWYYTVDGSLNGRNAVYIENAVRWYKEAALDTIATLIKR